ncbi:MAG: hypothetical protein ACTSRD_13100 [Promethearchaeota archaeon]
MSVLKTKSQDRIEYTCDVCGQNVGTINQIPDCLGCGKRLCSVCNKYMVCPQDFSKMNEVDKKKTIRMGKGLSRKIKLKRAFSIVPTILIGSMGVLFLGLTAAIPDRVTTIILSTIGSIFSFIAVIIFLVFITVEKRESKRYTRKIRDILIPYNIQRAPSSLIIHEKIHCSKCGGEIESTAEICEWCGSSVY